MATSRAIPDTITFNSAISACENSFQWQVALQLFADMPASTIEQDVYSYNSTMSACAVAGRWQVALYILAQMLPVSIEPDGVSYNCAISACEKACCSMSSPRER
eukprot:s451_g18.t1